MKKYRNLIPIVLIFFVFLSFYTLVSDNLEKESQYNKYLSNARKAAELGEKRAIENYRLALELKKTPEVYAEVAEYYKKQGNTRNYISWCETFADEFPKDPTAYELLTDAYVADERYQYAFDILETAEKRKVVSQKLEEIREQIKYVYNIGFGSYDEVGVFSQGYCAVRSEGFWGFSDVFGQLQISCRFLNVGAFSVSYLAPVVSQSGEAYFADHVGDKYLATKVPYKSLGMLSNGLSASVKSDSLYEYIDADFNVKSGPYEYASTFNHELAAVKKSEGWFFIDKNGKQAFDGIFSDVKLDGNEIAFQNGLAFVSKTSGKYILIDKNGNQVGNLEFEDAMPFAGTGAAAVKTNGKWGFVNTSGSFISDNRYENARSFSNGLAAVCIRGRWGFIDENENIAIEPVFTGARDFNEKGSCFVQQNSDKWQLLKLYRLNRAG